MVVRIPMIFRAFILPTAMQEAITLIKPYNCPETTETSAVEDSLEEIIKIFVAEHKIKDRLEQQQFFNKPRYFLIVMVSIAWDFLNVSNVFPRAIVPSLTLNRPE